MKKNKGLFISFEGPEASGKSTQILLLSKFLKNNNISHVVTREPGGTIISEKLRNLILSKKYKVNQLEEIMLLMAARSNHINNYILPNLKKGKIVVSDRFADSTFVYQGFVNKFGLEKSKKLHKELLNNFLPDKTFVFHLNVKDIIYRLKKRKFGNKYDRIDSKFHNLVNIGYKKIQSEQRFVKIDGSKSKTEIHNIIKNNLGF